MSVFVQVIIIVACFSFSYFKLMFSFYIISKTNWFCFDMNELNFILLVNLLLIIIIYFVKPLILPTYLLKLGNVFQIDLPKQYSAAEIHYSG